MPVKARYVFVPNSFFQVVVAMCRRSSRCRYAIRPLASHSTIQSSSGVFAVLPRLFTSDHYTVKLPAISRQAANTRGPSTRLVGVDLPGPIRHAVVGTAFGSQFPSHLSAQLVWNFLQQFQQPAPDVGVRRR